MTTQREQWIAEGKCKSCGGHYWAGRGYVGHAPLCPDRPQWRRPQSRSEQDRERRELTDTRGPIPLYDSPWSDAEDDRRVVLTKILRRAGQRTEGLRPKEDPE